MTGFPRRISEVPPRAWILLGLVALTFGIYGQTAWHPFINLDDEVLVSGNPHVRSGLTWENILWAFTSTSGASFWHPLTWLSHMLDVELFGMNAGGHHLVSVFLHALNAMFLFLVLARMTGFTWRSAFVAALFAVHPLHVESVAWAAERKDVLSTLFFFLSLWAYTRYAERPGTRRYIGVVLFFGMSLMSKPMGVTLPFVLLLLDWWPYCRMKGSSPEGDAAKFPVVPWSQLFLEKAPLILMAAGSAAVTLNFGGTPWTVPLETFPLGVRLTNAVVSYATYLWKFVYPSSLAVFYPHPATLHAEIPAWKITGAVLLLSGITFLSLREARVRPFLAMGWFFYLGTLVPVIGLVQVGAQAMADRFTYVPLIGVFVAIAWGFAETAKRLHLPRLVSAGAGIAMIMALAVLAWNQIGYWRDSVTLFSRALVVTNSNWLACNNLGTALEDSNRVSQAIPYFQEAIRIKPDYALAWNNLGEAYLQTGQFQKAVSYHWKAIQLQPNLATAWTNLGAALLQLGQTRQAIEYSMQAVRIKPDAYEAWNNMGLGYDKLGQVGEAFSNYRKALQINPEYPNARYNMGLLYARLNQFSEAVACFKEVVRYKPDFAEAWNNLGAANMQLGQYQEAIGCYREALRLKPDFAGAWFNLGTAYEKLGQQREADACYQEARRLNTK